MIGVDTNVLVRFIVNDDETQAQKAKDLIMTCSGKRHSLFVNTVTLCELIWVLKRGYGYTKNDLLATLHRLVAIEEFCFEDSKTMTNAIALYENGKADFSDYVSFSINKKSGCLKTYSFDKQPIQESLFEAVV